MYRIPDRWLEYTRCGEVIGDTGILASKTPLKSGFHRCRERPEGILPAEEFTPTQLVDYWEQKGRRIGLVVDLTFSYRYYDPKELRCLGVEHAKIPCPGQEIPDNGIYANFVEVLENHLALDDPGVIVVHCTHGVNRTGYLVCKFLVDHFSYSADDAIKAFNVARGHSMERENYIRDVHDYWKYIQDGGSTSDVSLQPNQSYNRDSWEPPSWRAAHHHPYGGWRHPQWQQHDFYSHSYHYDPYHEHYQQSHYGYTDFSSKPNRSSDGSRFHHRGFSHPHPQPPRNQSPPKHQHFSKDQPPPNSECTAVDQPSRAPPPRNQPPSKQHFSRDHSPHRNQAPLKHELFSTDHHSIPKDDLSPKNQTPSKDDTPVKSQPSPTDKPPKEQSPPKGKRRKGKATPKQHPTGDQPPPRQSRRKRIRGTCTT